MDLDLIETPLTDAEQDTLAQFLIRAQWPLKPDIFAAWVRKFVSVPIELAVFNQDGHVLLIYRKDQEYEGYHMPGTVLRDNEDVPTAINRLLSGEVGSKVTRPIPLGWKEVTRGNEFGQNRSRHEISLLHTCWPIGPYSGEGEFFPTDQLPENTLSHHKVLIEEMVKRLKSGEYGSELFREI